MFIASGRVLMLCSIKYDSMPRCKHTSLVGGALYQIGGAQRKFCAQPKFNILKRNLNSVNEILVLIIILFWKEKFIAHDLPLGPSINYVSKILPFFDPPSPLRKQVYYISLCSSISIWLTPPPLSPAYVVYGWSQRSSKYFA